MKTYSAKKLTRKQKKNKKLAALIAVTKLNDQDNQTKHAADEVVENSKCSTRKRNWNGSETQEDASPIKNVKETDVQLTTNNDEETKTEDLKNELFVLQSGRKTAPRFRLKATGDEALLEVISDQRVPLVLTDIQHLLLHSLLGDDSPYRPSRWYHIERHSRITQTTCFVVEGVSLKHLNKFAFPFINKKFQSKVEVLTPAAYEGSLVEELAAVPLSDVEKECLIKKYGSMEVAMESRKDLMHMMKAVFPVDSSDTVEKPGVSNVDNFSRTQLLLSAWQLLEENYPLPLKGKLGNTYVDYVMTKEKYQPVTPQSPMFGLDCEMCLTSAGSEVTRVSLVNENHETIYESFVKPFNEIVNYLTQYSGIKKEMLDGIEKRLQDVQNDLKALLPSDAILVGQSLNADLHALKMMHPYVIDTSVIFNITGERWKKSKLKVLAKEFLKEDIQNSKNGHCSVEDSIASLKLAQLKLAKSIDYGDAVLNNKKNMHRPLQRQSAYASTIFNHIVDKKKSSVIIVCDDMTGEYHEYLTKANEFSNSLLLTKKGKPKKVKLLTVDTQEDVITNVRNASAEHNFTMAHMKIDLDGEDGQAKAEQLDKWVEQVWTNLIGSAIFVLLFSGCNNSNGVAMVKVKGNA